MTLLEQCQIWHTHDQHQKIFDALEALPPEERTAATDMELARACNNLADPQTPEGQALLRRAIRLMEAHADALQDTYSWNFRLGYAYYYLDEEGPALRYFTRALELHPGDSPDINTAADIQSFMQDCRSRLALPRFQKTFRERTAAAWEAFAQGEEQLRRLLDAGDEESSRQAVALCGELLSPALENTPFALGRTQENYLLMLTPEGSRPRLFAVDYFKRHAPAEVLDRWEILAGRQPEPGFVMVSESWEIAPAEVQVWVEQLGEDSDPSVGLTLYCEKLLPLLQQDENHAWWMLSVLTDQILGEVASIRLVGSFQVVDAPMDGAAVSLDQLPAALREMGLDLSADPKTCIEGYSSYHFDPEPDPDADWRMDVIAGSTNCPPLLMGYLEEDDRAMDDYHRQGIAAGFFCWPLDSAQPDERTRQFFEFRDALKEALTEQAGPDALTLTGDAAGIHCGYLDFVAWDLPAVLDAAKAFFASSNPAWANFHSFRRNVSTIRLFTRDDGSALDPETGSLLSRQDIQALEACCEATTGYFYKMLGYLQDFIQDGIEAGRFTQRQAEQDLQIALWYAYACNNIGEYEYYYRAAQWMPASEVNAAGCGTWYYRYSCALTYCGRLEEARQYAEAGLREEPDYPWTWLQAAKLRAHFGDKAGALEAVRRGLERVPGDYEFLTLREEIQAGASLEQMEYHWIDPGADGVLQEGTDAEADEKLRSISCITTNPKGLAQFHAIFRPDPDDYEKDAPYCSFHYPVKGHPVELVFAMNEAALSKLDPAWLRTQKQRLDSGRWLTRQASLDETGTLQRVLFSLGRQVSLIYKTNRKDAPYFQVWLDNDGNLTARPDSEKDSEPDTAPLCYTEEQMRAVENHIAASFGAFENVLHEAESPDIHIDLCMVPPTEDRPYWTLVTMGMGACRMNIPRELAAYHLERAELAICLPPEWKLDPASLREERWYWPVRLLKSLARLPISEDTWLGWGHTTDNQEPFAPGTDLCAAILVAPPQLEDGQERCTLPGGETVNFYQVIPLYRSELNYKLAHDADTLLNRMDWVSFVVDPTRPDATTIDPPAWDHPVLDDAQMHLESIHEKALLVDDIAVFNHMAIYLRWCIEHGLMSTVFAEDYAAVIHRVREDPAHTDLRGFIRDKLAGQLLLNFFSPEGAAFSAFYYAGEDPSYPEDIDAHALDYFGPERYVSEEFQNEAYLFVPYDEAYYQAMAQVIQSRWDRWAQEIAPDAALSGSSN